MGKALVVWTRHNLAAKVAHEAIDGSARLGLANQVENPDASQLRGETFGLFNEEILKGNSRRGSSFASGTALRGRPTVRLVSGLLLG